MGQFADSLPIEKFYLSLTGHFPMAIQLWIEPLGPISVIPSRPHMAAVALLPFILTAIRSPRASKILTSVLSRGLPSSERAR